MLLGHNVMNPPSQLFDVQQSIGFQDFTFGVPPPGILEILTWKGHVGVVDDVVSN